MSERYEPHPIADSLPLMSEDGYAALRDRMAMNGYDSRHPIIIYQGKILDGRHRYRAAIELGIIPAFVHVPDTANPWEVAITGELRRDYGSQTQKAIVLKPLYEKSAEWQAERDRAREAANRARSDAAAGHEFRGNQHTRKEPEPGSAPTFGGATTKPIEPPRAESKPEPKNRQKAEALAAALGTGRKAVEEAEWIERHAAPEIVDAVKSGDMQPAEARRITKKAEIVQKLEAIAAREIEQPTGLFDVIVIDPPWPMEKIERDCRPNQCAFDYPTMPEAELSELSIPAADDCHVWLWTTHKFLPMAMRLLDAWSLKYTCTFVWHKPGGFQPIGLPQYNCEFALYARRGTPAFIDTKALPVCFNAPRGAHSEKPEEFYEMVRRVTGGRRLDMFNRRYIDGFSAWGKEAAAA